MKKIEEYQKKYISYQKIIIDQAVKYLTEATLRKDKELGVVLSNVIFNTEGPHSLEKNNLSEEQLKFINYYFKPLSEVMSSIDNLEISKSFFKHGYSKKLQITEEEYIRYHINSFLNELYIINNRINSLLSKIERYYKLSKSEELFKIIEILKRKNVKLFSGVNNIRGLHVHQDRYSDSDVEQIHSLCLLEKSDDKDFVNYMKSIKTDAFRSIRKKWGNICKKWIDDITIMLGYIFDTLMEYIIENDEIKMNI